MSNDELFRIMKEEATSRGMELRAYISAVLDAIKQGEARHPDNEQAAYKYAAALINERYPAVKAVQE